jgi:hypothetical protein
LGHLIVLKNNISKIWILLSDFFVGSIIY